MSNKRHTGRRTVLKTLGAGVVGGVAMATSVSADPPKQNGQIPVFLTWGDHEVWEMIDAEPPSRDRYQDAEGNDHAHAPLYLILPIPDSSHSPMFGPADQVIAVPGGPMQTGLAANGISRQLCRRAHRQIPETSKTRTKTGTS